MSQFRNILFNKAAAKKLAALTLIGVTAIASFATLGEGSKKKTSSKVNLLSSKTKITGSFSLKSGYDFRGNQVLTQEAGSRFINLNTTVAYQKGNTTFIVPLKKKVLLGNVKIDIGNRQFKKN